MDAIAESLAIEISKTTMRCEIQEMYRSSHHEEPRKAHQDRVVHYSNAAVAAGQPSTESRRKGRPFKEVKLFSHFHRFKSKIGHVDIHLSKFRTRAVLGEPPERYFRIRLDIFLAPWICSTGLSAIYSSENGPSGYHDICPSIRAVRVLLWSSDSSRHTLWDVIDKDDEEQFRWMLASGEISWRDQDEYGRDVFKVGL